MLTHIINDNVLAKEVALSTNRDSGKKQAIVDDISLIHQCMYKLLCASKENLDLRIQIALSSFLCTLLFDFIPGVNDFLTEGSNVQYVLFY